MVSNKQDKVNEEDLLQDPLGDRKLNDVPRIVQKRLTKEKLYVKRNGERSSKPNPEVAKDYMLRDGKLDKESLMAVLQQVTQLCKRDPNLVRVDGHVVMFGDIHGQYHDLCEIMRKQRFGQNNKKFLFLGDYVDRGRYGPEVISYLFSLKVKFPH